MNWRTNLLEMMELHCWQWDEGLRGVAVLLRIMQLCERYLVYVTAHMSNDECFALREEKILELW